MFSQRIDIFSDCYLKKWYLWVYHLILEWQVLYFWFGFEWHHYPNFCTKSIFGFEIIRSTNRVKPRIHSKTPDSHEGPIPPSSKKSDKQLASDPASLTGFSLLGVGGAATPRHTIQHQRTTTTNNNEQQQTTTVIQQQQQRSWRFRVVHTKHTCTQWAMLPCNNNNNSSNNNNNNTDDKDNDDKDNNNDNNKNQTEATTAVPPPPLTLKDNKQQQQDETQKKRKKTVTFHPESPMIQETWSRMDFSEDDYQCIYYSP